MTADKITPAEYRIFTEVEAATLLWNIDRERSITILRGVVKAMRQLLESAKVSTVITPFRKSKERRLWFLAMRKIAALKPELVQELVLENSSEDQSKRMTTGDFTE
ncbi:MAG TPA: hypothetical protein VNO14_04560, partial [Blastocatellia bacterium]|nr:hypothetical protein [Blastocatellia bacterium]